MVTIEACPDCQSRRVVSIVYGYPAVSDSEAARRGEVVLGGCLVERNSPDMACADCGATWLASAPAESLQLGYRPQQGRLRAVLRRLVGR